jgi:large repetitive protein
VEKGKDLVIPATLLCKASFFRRLYCLLGNKTLPFSIIIHSIIQFCNYSMRGNYTPRLLCKHFVAAFCLLFLSFSAASQTIALDNTNFSTAPYGQGSNIAMPITVTGCFATNNTFQLWLSDNNFSTETMIGVYNGFFTTYVNGIIPVGTTPGTNYQLRVKATSPVIVSAASAVFEIKANGTPLLAQSGTFPASRLLKTDEAFGFCSGQNNQTLTLTNECTAGATPTALVKDEITGAVFNPLSFTSNQLNFYMVRHYFTYIIKATQGGINSTRAYFLINSPNKLGLSTDGEQQGCLPAPLTFIMSTDSTSGIGNNFPGSQYSISWGDGTAPQTFKHCQIVAANGNLNHTYTFTACDSANISFNVTTTLINPWYVAAPIGTSTQQNCDRPQVTTRAKIFKQPVANFTSIDTACINTLVFFNNTSDPGQAQLGGQCTIKADYYWYIDGVLINDSLQTSPPPGYFYTFTTPGVHEIKLIVDNGSCGLGTKIRYICIQSQPTPNFKINGKDTIAGCTPLTFTPTNLSVGNVCRGLRFRWLVYNAATNAYIPPGTGIYTVVSAITDSMPTFTFNTPGNYIIRLEAGNSCGLFLSPPRYVNVINSAAVTFPANQQYCGLQTLTFGSPNLNHTPNYNTNIGNETYNWTVTGGTFNFVGGTSATSAFPQIQFTGYNTYFVKVDFVNACGTATATQVVTFYQPVTATVAPHDTTICYNVNTLNLNASFTGLADSIKWSTSGTGTFSATNIVNPVYTISTVDMNSGFVKLTFRVYPKKPTVCTPVTDTIRINIRPRNFGTNTTKTICSNTNVGYTAISSVVGSTFAWTSTVTSGTVTGNTASGTGNINDPLVNGTNNIDGIVTYTITPSANGCVGEPFILTVTVKPLPIMTVSNAVDTICSNTAAAIALSSSAAGVQFSWSSTFIGGTVTGNTQQATPITTATINDVLVNTGTVNAMVIYTVTVTGSGNCPGQTKKDTIYVRPGVTLANAGPDQKNCNQSTITLAGNTAIVGNGLWSQIAGPATTITTPSLFNTTVTGLTGNNTYQFVWTITGAGVCPPTKDTVVIINRPAITIPNAGADKVVCDFTTSSNNTTNLSANLDATRPFETGVWSIISQPIGGSGVFTSTTNPNTTFSFAKAGIYELQWQISNDAGCTPAKDTIIIKVYDLPVVGTVTVGNPNVCAGVNATFTLSSFTGVIQKWQYKPKLSAVWIDTAVTGSSITFNNVQDTFSVRVVIVSAGLADGCTTSAISNPVTINVAPATNAGHTAPNATVCSGANSGNVTVTGFIGTIVRWESSINNGTTWTPIATTLTSISYLNLTNTTWYRTIVQSGTCSGTPSDTTIITVIAPPTTPNAGPDQSLCLTTGTTLAANAPAVTETGVWSQFGGPSTPSFVSTANPNTGVGNLIIGTYNFVWSISNGVCPPKRDTVIVRIYDTLDNRINNNSVTICQGQTITINGFAVTGGTGAYQYQWQTSPDGLTWTNVTGAILANYTFSPTATVYVRRRVISGPCTAFSAATLITVQPSISNNKITASQTICINTTPAPLIGSVPTGGNSVYIYQWEQSINSGTTFTAIVAAIAKDYSPGVLTQTTLYRRRVTTSLCSGLQASFSDTMTITVNPDAKAQFNANPTIGCVAFLINTSVISTVGYPSQNGSYQWFVNNNLLGSGINFPGYTITTGGDSITVKLKAISLYGCKNDSVQQKFYTYPTPITNFTASDTVGCGPIAVSFTNTTNSQNLFGFAWTFGNGQTSNQTNPGTIIFQPSPFFIDTTYKVTLSAISACDTVRFNRFIRVKSKPKAIFTPDKVVGCSPMTVTFANNSKGTNVTYNWNFDDGTTFSTNNTNSVVHTFNTGVPDTFYVKLKATNECGTDSSVYSVIVSPNSIQLFIGVNGTQVSGCNPHLVNFYNNSNGATSFRWDFGDGNILNTIKNIDTVNHTYLTPGVFTVKVLASNGCSDTSTTRTITVYGKPTVNFTAAPTTVCLGDTVFFNNLSDTAISYLWKFGDGNTSTLTNPKKVYTAAGVYAVKLIGTKQYNAGNACTDSASRTVTVVTKLTGSFTASDTVSNCSPLTVTFTNLSKPSVLTTWDYGDGRRDTGDVVVHTYLAIGTYIVKMTAINAGGCTYEAVKTIRVNGPSGTFTYDNGFRCGSTPIRFQANAQFTDSLLWNFGDGTLVTSISPVVFHTYTQSGTYIPTVTLIGGATCRILLQGLDTIKIDYVKAGFKATQQKYCGYTTTVFTDTSRASQTITAYSWNFGDGGTSGVRNPVHNYTSTNTYPVRLVVISNSGCSDTALTQLFVKVNNRPTVNIASDSVGCVGQPFIFNSVVNSVDSVSFYAWTFSNGVASGAANTAVSFTPSGSYTAQIITGTIYNCYDTARKTVTINPTPNVRAGQDVQICRGQSTQLIATGGNGSYTWSPTNFLSCFNCANPIATPQFTTQYVVTGTNTFGCAGRDTIVVSVLQPFNITVSPNDTLCLGDSTRLGVSGALSYDWFPPTGLSSTTAQNPWAKPVVTTKYRVIGHDNYNCYNDTAYVTVAVGDYPKIGLGPDQILAAGATYQLNATFTNGPIRTWQWTPPNDLSCLNCGNPLLTAKKDVCYSVKATNIYGCQGSDTMCVKVFCESAQLFIPNAFTPDGDGVNDILMVRGVGVKLVKSFRIFNRWGQVVFERANCVPNDAAYGWDGKIKGVPAPVDVYVYTCEIVCENDTPFTYKGNVAILK